MQRGDGVKQWIGQYRHSHSAAAWLASLIATFFLAGCGSLPLAAAEIALGALGVKLPNDTIRTPKLVQIPLHIETAKNMNSGTDGQGLSVILRIYKLKHQHAFLTMPYSTFGYPDREREALGTSLLEVSELILAPGLTLDLKEKMPTDAAYLGVVALFRSPASYRWRFAFSAADAEKSGVTLGVHACAMTATNIAPFGMTVAETALLSSVRCQ